MAKYVYDRKTGEIVQVFDTPRAKPVAPSVMRDIPEYKSPLGTGLITSRSHRREDLKRGGAREVDPSEFKPRYINPTFATKRGLSVEGDQ
jgi:hypothetical protein